MILPLSPHHFTRAQTFIQRYARPLDRAIFNYVFDSAPAAQVLAELKPYQNIDGGFGHGLEPDFRLSTSSPMATSIALQAAALVDAPADHPLVRGAINYLAETCDCGGFFWHSTGLEVNDEPHAPWWHKSNLTAPSDEEWPNPSAELYGYLCRWGVNIDADLLAGLERRSLASLKFGPGPHPAYNLLCWQRAEQFLPERLRNALDGYFLAASRVLTPSRPEEMMEMRACWLAPSPNSSFARAAGKETLFPYIAAEIGLQAEDGSWQPNWSWGQYFDVWEAARVEWAGRLTVEVLSSLKAWGLIDA